MEVKRWRFICTCPDYSDLNVIWKMAGTTILSLAGLIVICWIGSIFSGDHSSEENLKPTKFLCLEDGGYFLRDEPQIDRLCLLGEGPPYPLTFEQISGSKSNDAQSMSPEVTRNMLESSKEAEKVIYSAMHVAQCRATCLDKFSSTVTSLEKEMKHTFPATGKMDDEIWPVPKPFRFKMGRKRRSSGNGNKFSSGGGGGGTPAACLENSSECSSCWESCQLLENKTASADLADDLIPGCSKNKSCTVGCQVACTFSKELSAKTKAVVDFDKKDFRVVFASDEPATVVGTNVLQLEAGKLAWTSVPTSSENGKMVKRPVVYVVIHQLPDRKWRQIVQTADAKVDTPLEMTLGTLRVMAVGTEGLITTYNPAQNASFLNVNSSSKVSAVSPNYVTSNPTDDPLDLRITSIEYGPSEVIVTLVWNEVRNRPGQKYQISWNKDGEGNLSGRSTRDDTSEQFTMLANSTYRIKVIQFEDFLYIQDIYRYPLFNTRVNSVPLLVNTSLALNYEGRPYELLARKIEIKDDMPRSYPKDNIPLVLTIMFLYIFGAFAMIWLSFATCMTCCHWTMDCINWMERRSNEKDKQKQRDSNSRPKENHEPKNGNVFSRCFRQKKDSKLHIPLETFHSQEKKSSTSFYSWVPFQSDFGKNGDKSSKDNIILI